MASENIALAFSADLIDKVNSLQLTGEFIATLNDIVSRQIRDIRNHVRSGGAKAADFGDWDELLTLLSLADTQIDIVRDTSRDFNAAALAAAQRRAAA